MIVSLDPVAAALQVTSSAQNYGVDLSCLQDSGVMGTRFLASKEGRVYAK